MIKKLSSILTLGSLLYCHQATSDDIEIYLSEGDNTGSPYLHIMLDYRPSVFNTLCTHPGTIDLEVEAEEEERSGGPAGSSSCAPPFMSQEAFLNLQKFVNGEEVPYEDGDKVSTFAGFVAVLKTVIENPEFDPIKLALVTPNKVNGGTILKGYTRLAGPDPNDPYLAEDTILDPNDPDYQDRGAIIDVLNQIPEASGNDAHFLQPKETYLEWFRYINGGDVLNGTQTAGNFGTDPDDPNNVPVPDYDESIIDDLDVASGSGTYNSPFDDAGECPKVYSIMMAMNQDNWDEDHDDIIEREMSPSAAAKGFENMLTWMHRGDTDLINPTIGDAVITGDVNLQKTWVVSDSGSIGSTRDWAAAGGSGSPLNLEDPKDLEADLRNALIEVISVSSTFVAASVPVNVFNQTKSLDNLFVALFEAQETLNWPGNLKKLKLADTFDPGDPNNPDGDGVFDEIVDVNGNPGFESTGDNKGRISFNAVTYWTDVDSLPSSDSESVPVEADGREVPRGGAGQKIDGFVNYDGGTDYIIGDANGDTNSRQVFVESLTSESGFDDFDATNTVADSLKSLLDPGNPDITRSEALDLIKWGRGQDPDSNQGAARTWILADAIHSRPFALNYGTAGGYSEENPNIRLFMGTGDGMFHIIENTDNDADATETGREVFAFYPREMLDRIKLRMEDSISATRMRYGVDGEPVVYTKDLNSDGTLDHSAGDKAYVFFGLRRGGSSYYALDVSNPSATKLLWKISKTDGGDFGELGLTFSTPVVGTINVGGSQVDVLVFAGGYNGGWNDDYTARVGKDLDDNDDSVGNAIYIVNAHTGALIWKAVQGTTGDSTNSTYEHAGLVDSIPSNVTVLKNLSGNIHRIYVGDTGGAIWRVDLPEDDGTNTNHRKENWFITKLAELGTDGTTTDRRFFHAPDVVETFDDNGKFDGIIIQSGDRAHPNETDVDNYMFYIRDRLFVTGDPIVKAENDVSDPPGRYVFDSDQTNGLQDRTACVIGTETDCDTLSSNGWKIAMLRDGEKGLSSPLVDAGRVFFTTFRPASSGHRCEPSEGQGSIYLVNLLDGSAVANNERIYDIGPGIPPGAILIGDVILLPGGGIDVYDIDGDGTRDISKLPQSLTKKIYQIYWREPGVDKL